MKISNQVILLFKFNFKGNIIKFWKSDEKHKKSSFFFLVHIAARKNRARKMLGTFLLNKKVLVSGHFKPWRMLGISMWIKIYTELGKNVLAHLQAFKRSLHMPHKSETVTPRLGNVIAGSIWINILKPNKSSWYMWLASKFLILHNKSFFKFLMASKEQFFNDKFFF